MRDLSNYPPGHPTGIQSGELTEAVYYCEGCYTLWPAEALKRQKKGTLTCPTCRKPLERAMCERCEKPATHIDEDRAVNAAEAFCSEHNMWSM